MTLKPRPSHEQYLEKLEAKRRLALMRMHRGLAERCETAVTPSLQAEYAQRYREVVGVEPRHRELFREALERVRDGGGATVQDVIDLIRARAYANGSSLGPEMASGGGAVD